MDSYKAWIWVGAALAVVIVAIGAGFLLLADTPVTVPSVTGMTEADAVRALQAADLKLGTTTPAVPAVDSTGTPTAPGTVVMQAPAAGSKTTKGGFVDLAIAEAAPLATVPDVTSMEASAAASAVASAGLAPTVYSDYSTSTPAGQVFGQVPLGGQKVEQGTNVALGVSLGERPASPVVPNVVGKTKAEATAALDKAGFGAETFEGYSTKVAAGKAIVQFPKAGTKALAGSTVAVEISKGSAPAPAPATVGVPNVTGDTQSSATTALKNAGLAVQTFTVFSSSVAKGSVVGQLPAAGSQVAKGTVVGLAISDGAAPASVKVPNVVGMTESDAKKALEGAGLRAVVVPEYTTAETAGKVLAQLPVYNSTVPPGSQIAVEVATDVKPVPLPEPK